MIIKKYRSIITSLENPIEDIYTLELRSLRGIYKYDPGQFLHLALDTEYDGDGQWPESRCFSMQSNPDEETIRITYSIKGRFTKMMQQELSVGSKVWLKLPYGDLFSRSHNKGNTVFVAGGTGVTPFLSLFNHRSFSEYTHPRIYLGFRSHEYNIYENELMRLSNSSHFVNYRYENLDGRLDIQHVFNENGQFPDYFISGPPEMIRSFRDKLITNGVPILQIKTDDWE